MHYLCILNVDWVTLDRQIQRFVIVCHNRYIVTTRLRNYFRRPKSDGQLTLYNKQNKINGFLLVYCLSHNYEYCHLGYFCQSMRLKSHNDLGW